MSLAFSTLAIALFVLMPGFFLEQFLYSGKMARVRAATPTLTDLAVSVAFSVPVHIVTLWALERGHLMLKPVDTRALMGAIAGQFGNDLGILDRIADSIAYDRWEIALYLVATAVVAFALGNLLQLLLLLVPFWSKLLPIPNRWFYTFFFPQGTAVSSCHAYILTKASTESRLLLYQGDVTDFKTGSAGDLIEVQLRNSQRGVIKFPEADAQSSEVISPEEDVRWTPLNQSLLVLPGDQIANISLSHLVAWRPLVILARGQVTLSAGQREGSVDLSRGSALRRAWLRLALARWLPLEPSIMVMARPPVSSTEQDAASLVAGHTVKVDMGKSVEQDTKFQVVAVRRTVQDIRADDNFLLRHIQRLVVKPWAQYVETRANHWT